MKKIAIIGAGPTGIYTLYSLFRHGQPLAVSVFEQADEAGVGMPYSDEDNSRLMLANIASIEIPPIFRTYLDWLKEQSAEHLARYGVEHASLHDRKFLPRILLGEYFRDQFLELVKQAKQQGFEITVRETCRVTDLEATTEGVRVWAEEKPLREVYDLAVIATGHVWPDESESTRTFFPSPWSGLMEAKIGACRVGIMGTSLSGIDAAMAVAVQHGSFIEVDAQQVRFELDKESEALEIVLMSRSGILPEADFYCPLPYEPLSIVTESAIEQEIAKGAEGLLDRVFSLMTEELELADPAWSEQIALRTLNPQSFHDALFAPRHQNDPFEWAEANLAEVECNKRDKRTVAWRYTILRLHEAVQEIVHHLNDEDGRRFHDSLARVFIDNYAAIPSESVRRLLALHKAGIISIQALGPDYELEVKEAQTVIYAQGKRHEFKVYIDARGQKALKTKDLPFPTLREQLLSTGDDIPDVSKDYTLLAPEAVRGRIAFGALPWLMHDQPFVQGLVVCAEMGEAMAKAIFEMNLRPRRQLTFIED